ncbi:TonB family protein [Methylophilaceae bacterium]|jgi:TonB family protein|nr:TonB family protein [Methylophilaceae bacterium]|tara:strand:- start:849 stop:1559 length:711 start_codon:yes stop_codon:yes gene_type:complete
MNNYKKYGLLIAIIFSILFHLIIIKNFSFTFLSSNVQEDFEDMEVSLIKSFPTETKKNVLPNVPLNISDSHVDIKNNIVISNKKPVVEPEMKIKSSNKLIDTSEILSQIKNMGFTNKRQQRVKSISANTTDYLYKLYFDAWRQKVEKIGAMNYPKEASELGMFGSMRLTVSLNSDGTIKSLFINKSSGHPELDQAALNIVRLGEPYARFPAEILKNVDIINITRRWKFTEKNSFFK